MTVNLDFPQATDDSAEALAELRVLAMRESLEAIGRFDPTRARQRFLDSYISADTRLILKEGELIGFFVTCLKNDHFLLDHLYLHPEQQSSGVGRIVVDLVKADAEQLNLPIRLGALRGSRSNHFYLANGFKKTHEGEWDIYYDFTPE